MATHESEALENTTRPPATKSVNATQGGVDSDAKISYPSLLLNKLVQPMIDGLTHLSHEERIEVRGYLDRSLSSSISHAPGPSILGGVFPFLSVVILLAMPAALMAWSSSSHSWAAYLLIYVASLLLGGVLSNLFLRPIERFGYDAIFYGVTSDSLLPSIAWALAEYQKPGSEMDAVVKARNRQILLGGLSIVVVLVSTAGLVMLRDSSLSIWLEVILIALVAGLTWATFLILILILITARPLIRSDPSMLYGQLALELLNLAYLAQHCQRNFHEGNQKYLILRLERTAASAERQLRSRFREALKADPQTKSRVARHAHALAATIRAHKYSVAIATGSKDMDKVVQSLCSGLVAAAVGNHEQLTAGDTGGNPVSRWVLIFRSLLPSILIGLAAIFIPMIPGIASSSDVQDSLRLSLAIPAVLSLLVALVPDSERATDNIHAAVIKYIPGLPDRPIS